MAAVTSGNSVAETFYREAIGYLVDCGVPFLLGGAYAFKVYTGIWRETKDLDVFVRPAHVQPILRCLKDAGYRTELTDPVWLAKAYHGEFYVDVIFGSGNGYSKVDDAWFAHAPTFDVFGRAIGLVPPEEMIWSKAYVMERERFDGADVAHLILRCGKTLNWHRLLDRAGPHWGLLQVYLDLFQFIYPADVDAVPAWVYEELCRRSESARREPPAERISRGLLLSRTQFLIDLEEWGYRPPPELPPRGTDVVPAEE